MLLVLNAIICGLGTRGQGVQWPHEGSDRDRGGTPEVKEKAKACQKPQDAERSREDHLLEPTQGVWLPMC